MGKVSQSGAIDITDGLDAVFAEMEKEGRARLSWFNGEIIIQHSSADMRYGEQVFEINVPLDGVAMTREAIEEAFHQAHERLYTYALRDQDVVLVNAGVSVIGRLPAAAASRRDVARCPPGTRRCRKSHRQVFLGGWIDVPIYDFDSLAAGQAVAGPAIIESDTTTVLLRDTETARFDPRGWLDIALP